MNNTLSDVCNNDDSTNNYPRWSFIDAVWWKTFGGSDYITKYKDGYVAFHKDRIKSIAKDNNIPAILLALVARTEAGGMPDNFKYPVLLSRQINYMGNNWFDDKIGVLPRPEKTSMGIIAMQIRVVAEIFNKDPVSLSNTEMIYISNCLHKDNFNLSMVAHHLRDLINYDYPDQDPLHMSDEQIIVLGSRYNRGTQRSLEDFIHSIYANEGAPEREWSSYGRSLIRHKSRVAKILGSK